MLTILQEEFNTIPLAYTENQIYNCVKAEFTKLLGSDAVAENFLSNYWHYTLRELSCNSIVNIMKNFRVI